MLRILLGYLLLQLLLIIFFLPATAVLVYFIR